MKKALIIGSTVVDVIVNLVDSLPTTGEDVHVRSQHMSLGGCAYNVSDSVRHFQIPYILFSPVGTGVYGYFVREELKKKGCDAYYFPSFEEIESFCLDRCQKGDVLITMGAGNVVNIGENLLTH